MAPKPPDWQIGDAVYGLRLDPETGLYRVHGEGRVVRIEGGMLHLATTKGPRTWGVTDWPAFKTRAEGEAYIKEQPRPGGSDRGPMAHHVAVPAAAAPAPTEPEWQCLRCERIRDGKMVDDDLDHTRRCPYRGTGRDPALDG